jgi:NADP-reducing hydrogenase subunit HndB
MAKMTLDELRKLRGEKKAEMAKRDSSGKTIQVIVGMGTCGISAGAKLTVDAFINEVNKQGLGSQVLVKQSSCMGMCSREPTVEIIVPGMTDVIYGDVKADVVPKVVKEHIIDRKEISDMVVARRGAGI